MKRSFFSVTMLAFVLAFLYIPIVFVFVYAFVPDGQTMSFVGDTLPRYLPDEEKSETLPGEAGEAFLAEWKRYPKRDLVSPQGETNAVEAAWLAQIPRDEQGKAEPFDTSVAVGDLRLTRFGRNGHPFVFVVTKSQLAGYDIVPLSPLSVPASERELAHDGRVYQLWNRATPVGAYVRETWRIGSLDAGETAEIASAAEAARPGLIHNSEVDKGPIARYEKQFVATFAKTFLGFDPKWYTALFSSEEAMTKAKKIANPKEITKLRDSFWLSLIIGGLATLISCVIGTTSALALHRWRDRLQSVHHALVYTPLVMPDILIGISLLMLFVACGVNCGFWTILIAHVTFCVSYVVMTVLARLQDFDDRIVEAAHDLGAGPFYTFFHVELPILLPGIVAGGLLAFTLSIDDVVITTFVNSAGTDTFPTLANSMQRYSKAKPAIFAMSTLMMGFTCLVVVLTKLISRKNTLIQKGK